MRALWIKSLDTFEVEGIGNRQGAIVTGDDYSKSFKTPEVKEIR